MFRSVQMDESDSPPPLDASTVTASRVRTTADSSMVPENMLDYNLLCFTAQTEFIASRLSSLFGPAQYLRPLALLMNKFPTFPRMHLHDTWIQLKAWWRSFLIVSHMYNQILIIRFKNLNYELKNQIHEIQSKRYHAKVIIMGWKVEIG